MWRRTDSHSCLEMHQCMLIIHLNTENNWDSPSLGNQPAIQAWRSAWPRNRPQQSYVDRKIGHLDRSLPNPVLSALFVTEHCRSSAKGSVIHHGSIPSEWHPTSSFWLAPRRAESGLLSWRSTSFCLKYQEPSFTPSSYCCLMLI